MKWWARYLIVFSLAAGDTFFAAGTDQFSVIINTPDDGTERLSVRGSGFPTNAPKEKVDSYVREVVFPKMQADAAKGIQPAAWQIGYFYLNGWGVEQDLKQAEAAFRAAPEPKLGRGLWRLGYTYLSEKHDYAKAEALFVESLETGCKLAAKHTATLARAYLYGWWKLKADQAKAEQLLQKIAPVFPESRSYLLSMACLRKKQDRHAEAYEFATRAAPKFRDQPKDYRLALSIRLLSALRAGKLSEIKPEEMLDILRGIGFRSQWILWLVLAVALPMLAGLVLWTYLTRKRGPGLMLSVAWICVMSLAAGLGFMVTLPAAINNAAGRWMGAILTAASCLVSARLAGGTRYFGTEPLVANFKAALRIGGLLVALLAGLLTIGFGYEFFYKQITGHRLDSQLVAALLKCNTTSDFVVTLTVAGLLIPFYEEIMFRGFLFGALERRWGGWWALGVSSVIFAIIHGLTYAPPLLCIALALGWLRLRTGDLRQSILLHCLNNTLAILVLNIFER